MARDQNDDVLWTAGMMINAVNHSDKANVWLRLFRRHYTLHVYRRKIRRIRHIHPDRFARRSPPVERAHRLLWSHLTRLPAPDWLRFYAGVSGADDAQYVPEDIYYAVIDHVMNDANYSRAVADKNFYDRHFDPSLFPAIVLRNVSGTFLDSQFRIVTELQACQLFDAYQDDIVVKPSIRSTGGRNVILLRRRREGFFTPAGKHASLAWCVATLGRDFVVQECLKQHHFFSTLNPSSVNSLRIATYRSVVDNTIVVLKCVMRIGRRGSSVDNVTAGGLSCGILANGALDAYACTRAGHVHASHPDSGVVFKDLIVPGYAEAVRIARNAAATIPSHRLLAFDLVVTASGCVRLLEINPSGQGINLLQMYGGSLFGKRTEEVVAYCTAHAGDDNFEVLRLWQ